MDSRMVDVDWHALFKCIEGRDLENWYEHNNAISGAAGVRRPNETKKARAKVRGDEFL